MSINAEPSGKYVPKSNEERGKSKKRKKRKKVKKVKKKSSVSVGKVASCNELADWMYFVSY